MGSEGLENKTPQNAKNDEKFINFWRCFWRAKRAENLDITVKTKRKALGQAPRARVPRDPRHDGAAGHLVQLEQRFLFVTCIFKVEK